MSGDSYLPHTLKNTVIAMVDFSKETREDLVGLFKGLARTLDQMNQLPHEMVSMFISKQDDKTVFKLKEFWAGYLEYLAKLVREVSPLYPD